MNEKLKLLLIYGSNRENRFCDTVARWTISKINQLDEYEVMTADPAKMNLSLQGQNSEEELQDFRRKVKEADAFVIVVPELNHGYPAILKYLIDADYGNWRAKPVSFVSYGGMSGGVRAVEQLRQVFCELHTMTTRDSVHLANPWEQFQPDGNLANPQIPEKMFADTFKQLSWWANALRNARLMQPYLA